MGGNVEVEANAEVGMEVEVELDANIEVPRVEVGGDIDVDANVEIEVEANVEAPALEVEIGGDVNIEVDASGKSKGSCLGCTKCCVCFWMSLGKVLGWLFITAIWCISISALIMGCLWASGTEVFGQMPGQPIYITFFIVLPILLMAFNVFLCYCNIAHNPMSCCKKAHHKI